MTLRSNRISTTIALISCLSLTAVRLEWPKESLHEPLAHAAKKSGSALTLLEEVFEMQQNQFSTRKGIKDYLKPDLDIISFLKIV